MSASFLDQIKSGPPAPKVALLADHRFFVRAIPVGDAATQADVAAQVVLSLEGMSPFPPAQLYYGFFWVEGSPHALVFSSYRKRFTPEQQAEWARSTLVAPAFAAFLGVDHEPATTLVAPSADGLTAIYWESGRVPTKILTVSIPPEAPDEDRVKAHDELLKAVGGSRTVIDVHGIPEIVNSPDESKYAFRAGDYSASLPVAWTPSMDVRDPDELAAWRKAAKRDLLFWRLTAGAAAALILLGILQLALNFGGKSWTTAQATQISLQTGPVDDINMKARLAQSIEDRSTKRLLPLEELTIIGQLPAKGTITFTQMSTSSVNNLYQLSVNCSTQNPGEIDAFRNALQNLDSVDSVDVKNQRSQAGVTSFTLYVTFKPGALQSSVQPAVAAN